MKILYIILAILLAANFAYAQVGVAPQDRGGTPFNCHMVSTATTLTEITGCAVPSNAGRSYYITSLNWSSSIISTTTNFMLIRSGTGTNCATGTVSHYAGFALAFTSNPQEFPEPLKIPAGHAICFIHPGAGTRNLNITGYIA